MTATHELLSELTEGSTYQISTSVEPSGSVHWHLALYGRLDPELAALIREDSTAPDGVRAAGEDLPVWNEVASRVTGQFADGDYKPSALAWLAEVTGLDPAVADCVLILPDCVERINQS